MGGVGGGGEGLVAAPHWPMGPLMEFASSSPLTLVNCASASLQGVEGG